MELYVFIGLIIVCAILTSIFIYYRTKYGSTAGLFTKALASFGFVALALFCSFSKMQATYYANISVFLFILGLICGLIGDILLDLKVMYSFHEDKYLKAGMTAFGLGHIFYIAALLNLASTQIDVFSNYLTLLLIVGASVILSLLIYVLSKKIFKLNFGKTALITNVYSFLLIFVTALSIYLSFISDLKIYIVAAGFVLFLISDLILSMQYFGGKQGNKKMIIANHLFYYLAQIIIAMYIYFI